MLGNASVLAVVTTDVVSSAVLLAGMRASIPVALGFDPGSASRQQLSLERESEYMSGAIRLATVGHFIATLLTLYAVNHALPSIIPGAMCGQGVAEGMADASLVILARLLALLALGMFSRIDRENRTSPMAIHSRAVARAGLLAGTFGLLASYYSIVGFVRLDAHKAVSCCTAVMPIAEASEPGAPHASGGTLAYLIAAAVAAALTLGLALWNGRQSSRPTLAGLVLLAASAATYAWSGFVIVKRVSSPNVFGLLAHQCPFCLFHLENYGIGYGLFGSLLWMLSEFSSAVALRAVFANTAGEKSVASGIRCALRRGAIATMTFVLLSAWPVVAWRLRTGTWLVGLS